MRWVLYVSFNLMSRESGGHHAFENPGGGASVDSKTCVLMSLASYGLVCIRRNSKVQLAVVPVSNGWIVAGVPEAGECVCMQFSEQEWHPISLFWRFQGQCVTDFATMSPEVTHKYIKGAMEVTSAN